MLHMYGARGSQSAQCVADRLPSALRKFTSLFNLHPRCAAHSAFVPPIPSELDVYACVAAQAVRMTGYELEGSKYTQGSRLAGQQLTSYTSDGSSWGLGQQWSCVGRMPVIVADDTR